jgi:hypothetical protein
MDARQRDHLCGPLEKYIPCEVDEPNENQWRQSTALPRSSGPAPTNSEHFVVRGGEEDVDGGAAPADAQILHVVERKGETVGAGRVE